MAKSFDDLVKLFDDLEDLMENLSPESASNDCLALVKNRVINTGTDANGNTFEDGKGETAYSDKQVPIFFYGNKKTRGNNSRRIAELEKKKKPKTTASYAEWREINNLRVDHVNFQFTGEMWESMEVIVEQAENPQVVAFWSRNDETQDKIIWNSKRYFGFTNPSKEEFELCSSLYAKPVTDFMDKNFNKIR